MITFDHAEGSAADLPESARVRDLKRRIDFEAAVASERTDEHVALQVESFAAPASVASWQLRRGVDTLGQGEVLVNMRFTQGEQLVTARFTLFAPAERLRVARTLIDRADAVTTVEIGDLRGPRELGTLSLAHEAGGTVYWIYRNVYAEVIVYRTQVDKFAVARDMQAQFEAALQRR